MSLQAHALPSGYPPSKSQPRCLQDAVQYPLLFSQAGQVRRHFVWRLTEQCTELHIVLWAPGITCTSADGHIWLELFPCYRTQDFWRHKIRVHYPNRASFSIASNHYYFGTLVDPPGDLQDFWSLTDIPESQWLPKTVIPRKAYVSLLPGGFVQTSQTNAQVI